MQASPLRVLAGNGDRLPYHPITHHPSCRLAVLPSKVPVMVTGELPMERDGAALVGRLISDHIGAGGLAVVATHLDIAIAGPVETLTFARMAA